jgi:Domain of unknown function (DUF4331)
MSSHREAPEVSKDPVVDNTDTYAFVSPDNPETVTIITNYLPAEVPAGGPTFFEFGDDVLYKIHIDNDGDGRADITYEFSFESTITNPNTFLYNTGPISSLTDPNWSKRQSYSIRRVDHRGDECAEDDPKDVKVLGEKLACPPCNIGPRSTPNYSTLEKEAVHALEGGQSVFAGQRNDPFFVDIGSIFDLADLRPFQNLHLFPSPATPGVDTLSTLNVHSIALQVPIKSLTLDGSVPTNVMSSKSVLGVWGSASRRKVRITDGANSERSEAGPWVQVSRLGNPLVNEALIPMSLKDAWNAVHPVNEREFLQFFQHPELAKLLPVLYPKVFPKLEGLTAPREDLVAILLTGLPAGVVPGFQNNTGKVLADMLRLNVAVAPAKEPNILGILGGDLAGFPNGRRVIDDVTTVELRAIAGLTVPLVDKSFTPDEAASAITQGITALPFRSQSTFPYVATPHDGFDFPSTTK